MVAFIMLTLPVPFHFRTRLVFALSALGILLLASSAQLPAQMPQEKPKGFVNDYASVLSPQARQRIEALCTELDQKARAQLAVVTVQSLEGRPVEDFAIDLAMKWGVGRKARQPGDQAADRGVLLLLAVGDRRSRIEVGYGLEPIIPDGRAGDILRSMTEYLRAGDYDSALGLGVGTIASIIARDANVTLTGAIQVDRSPRGGNGDSFSMGNLLPILFIVVILVILSSKQGGRRGGFWMGPGGWGGGGFGGGSSGGGGFGGFGGGSFGGGGASGRW